MRRGAARSREERSGRFFPTPACQPSGDVGRLPGKSPQPRWATWWRASAASDVNDGHRPTSRRAAPQRPRDRDPLHAGLPTGSAEVRSHVIPAYVIGPRSGSEMAPSGPLDSFRRVVCAPWGPERLSHSPQLHPPRTSRFIGARQRADGQLGLLGDGMIGITRSFASSPHIIGPRQAAVGGLTARRRSCERVRATGAAGERTEGRTSGRASRPSPACPGDRDAAEALGLADRGVEWHAVGRTVRCSRREDAA